MLFRKRKRRLKMHAKLAMLFVLLSIMMAMPFNMRVTKKNTSGGDMAMIHAKRQHWSSYLAPGGKRFDSIAWFKEEKDKEDPALVDDSAMEQPKQNKADMGPLKNLIKLFQGRCPVFSFIFSTKRITIAKYLTCK